MTPEQRLSVFAAQTADDFISNSDAVGLLFDMLATQNEKIDRLVDTTTSEFRIIGQGAGAGFYATTAITMFTSTIAVTIFPYSTCRS